MDNTGPPVPGAGPSMPGAGCNTPGNESAMLDVVNLAKSFGPHTVLDGVSFDLRASEVVALVGPSGSGKSTLLSILTGALQPDRGEILFEGAPVPQNGRPFAYMPQRDVLLPWRRVVDNAGIGLEVAGMSRREARRRVQELLDRFGLAGTERYFPRQLSGGMRQRVSFLRTVVQDLPVLLLDEPFGALDAITRDELQQWLLSIWEVNAWSILLITHDIREALRLADRVLVLPSRPVPLLDEVTVPRGIPRIDGFVSDPRVAALEERLHKLLHQAAH